MHARIYISPPSSPPQKENVLCETLAINALSYFDAAHANLRTAIVIITCAGTNWAKIIICSVHQSGNISLFKQARKGVFGV